MDIKLVARDDEGELIMSGDLDTRTSKDADALFVQIADRFKNVTLNMKDLEYVSSAGLRAIRNLYIKVNQNGGKLSLTNVNENVMEVFEMTGLAGLLNILHIMSGKKHGHSILSIQISDEASYTFLTYNVYTDGRLIKENYFGRM